MCVCLQEQNTNTLNPFRERKGVTKSSFVRVDIIMMAQDPNSVCNRGVAISIFTGRRQIGTYGTEDNLAVHGPRPALPSRTFLTCCTNLQKYKIPRTMKEP